MQVKATTVDSTGADAVTPIVAPTANKPRDGSHPRHTVVNHGSVTVFLGPSNVTSSTGIPLYAGYSYTCDLDRNEQLFGITASSTADVRCLQV
jgi:hypothetical protein